MKNNIKKGQGLVEIAIIISIVAIFTLVTFTPIGESVVGMLEAVTPRLSDQQQVAKSVKDFEEIIAKDPDLNYEVEIKDEDGNVVMTISIQDKLEIVKAVQSGKDLTPEQFNALMNFLESNGKDGVEVSGVLSDFLLDGLTDEELKKLAKELGLDEDAFDKEDIAEALGIDDVTLEEGEIPADIMQKLQETRDKLIEEANADGATERKKDAAIAFSDALDSGSSVEIMGVLNEYSAEIADSNQLKQAILNLMSVEKNED